MDQAKQVPARRVRIGIVDDHSITRRSLCDFLKEQDGFDVVGQATNGREAIDLARSVAMDVMLLDIEMPGQSGIDSLARIVARAPRTAVLMLSGHPPASFAVALLKKGAAGYLNKQCDPHEIVKAIRTVADGHRYLNEELGDLLVDGATEARAEPHHQLTDRQFQVFLRLARGQTPTQVAAELSLTRKSVSSYRNLVMAKLGLSTNSELTYYAIKHGLLD